MPRGGTRLHGILPVHLGSSTNASARGGGGGRMSPGGQFGGAVESGPWWPQRSRAQDGKAGWRQGMWAQQLPQRGREAVGPPL